MDNYRKQDFPNLRAKQKTKKVSAIKMTGLLSLIYKEFNANDKKTTRLSKKYHQIIQN